MTTTAQIKAAFDARATDVADLRSIYEGAEGRDLTPDEQRKEAALSAAIEERDAYIERGLDAIESEARSAEFMERLNGFGTSESASGPNLYSPEVRALSLGEVGPALVPDEHARDVVHAIARATKVAGIARQFDTVSDQFVMPAISVNVEAGLISEGSTITAVDPTFAPVTAVIHKSAIRTLTSEEAWEDSLSSVPMQEVLTEQHIRAHARAWDNLALNGAGPGFDEPQGLVGHPDITDTAAGAVVGLDIVAEAIARLVAKGLEPEEITVLLPAAVWNTLQTSTDNNGRYVMTTVATDGVKRSVFGSDVVLTDFLPTDGGAGTNEATIVAGAFDYAGFVTREDVRVEVSKHAHFDTAQIALRSIMRAGFGVIDPTAFETVSGLTY